MVDHISWKCMKSLRSLNKWKMWLGFELQYTMIQKYTIKGTGKCYIFQEIP